MEEEDDELKEVLDLRKIAVQLLQQEQQNRCVFFFFFPFGLRATSRKAKAALLVFDFHPLLCLHPPLT